MLYEDNFDIESYLDSYSFYTNINLLSTLLSKKVAIISKCLLVCLFNIHLCFVSLALFSVNDSQELKH